MYHTSLNEHIYTYMNINYCSTLGVRSTRIFFAGTKSNSVILSYIHAYEYDVLRPELYAYIYAYRET